MSLLMLSTPILAQEKKDKVFTALTYSYIGLSGIDTGLTIYAHQRIRGMPNFTFYELNPVCRATLDRPALLIGTQGVLIVSSVYLCHQLKKKNKVLGYIAIVVLNGVRAYCVYNNVKELSKIR